MTMADKTDSPASTKTKIFVVGLGMVGIAFIEKLLALDPGRRYHVTTCGAEAHLAYNRVAISDYFQHRNVESLYLHDSQWYMDQEGDRFEFHVNEEVTEINTSEKTVRTSRESVYKYDILVLATGSDACWPPYVTPERAKHIQGVFVYRSIADLDAIISYTSSARVKSASIIGGGLLGLEAAKAVYDLPTAPAVSILIRGSYPLSRQLDASAGALVLKRIEKLGVKVYTNTTPTHILTETSPDGNDVFTGLKLQGQVDGEQTSDIVIFAIGIEPRDNLARQSGIKCGARGGVEVGDNLETSVPDVYAIGECANWHGQTYGLIAPGIEMADILAFNLTQTDSHAPRAMNNPDLSTKLKLMGVDVASFGDYFADRTPKLLEEPVADSSPQVPAKKHRAGYKRGDPTACLTYHDPFSATYKKYIFSADGEYLVGGMMVGDVDDFTKVVSIVQKKKKLEVPPSEFIIGAKKGQQDGQDLDDDVRVCSCHNVTKGAISSYVSEGVTDFAVLKQKTKAGTGCGGCIPLVTNIFKAALKAAGHTLNSNLCVHFKMSRADLFQVVKIKKLQDFRSVMAAAGTNSDSLGCETCKPAVASILSSLYNDFIMKPQHHGLQDSNDRFLANIQRDGTFSVIPRVPAGEIKPDGLIAIGQIAKEYGLYTKITGGQRIDMFGAKRHDLPDIWEKLIHAGFESGHAYGKALRTVKSCVGTSWCRFGIGDSVGLAVDLENRYKGIRSPHKLKGGVSGCVRECAEAQSKDFGLIATDKGWNIFIAGNGGANPRHATLFAADVPPSNVVKILDRYLMFYIRTADKLMRTARWVESFEGGLDKLKKILLDDELGICADLEAEMAALVGTYENEWARVVDDPALRTSFRQFSNTDESRPQTEIVVERGQARPADWPKALPPVKFDMDEDDAWSWVQVGVVDDLKPTQENATSAAVKYGEDSQLALFHVPKRGYFAIQQMCPHKRAFVLDHGIVGDDASGKVYVSCPLHKRNYRLDTGECLNDPEVKVLSFKMKEEDDRLYAFLPPPDELDGVIGNSQWMIRKATAEALGKNAAASVKIVAPGDTRRAGRQQQDDTFAQPEAISSSCGGVCGGKDLDW